MLSHTSGLAASSCSNVGFGNIFRNRHHSMKEWHLHAILIAYTLVYRIHCTIYAHTVPTHNHTKHQYRAHKVITLLHMELPYTVCAQCSYSELTVITHYTHSTHKAWTPSTQAHRTHPLHTQCPNPELRAPTHCTHTTHTTYNENTLYSWYLHPTCTVATKISPLRVFHEEEERQHSRTLHP